MNNSRIHTATSKKTEAKLTSIKEQMVRKNIEVRFITAYAPILNPTELIFNLFRQQTENNRPRNYEEMKSAIKRLLNF